MSNPNGDLIGQGSGNIFAGLFGGLPIISEVVRSSANVGFNAKSKWSNFFHGLFLLLAMIFMIPVIELIPNAALAAMLIYAGYNLAAPKHFINAYQIGKEQFFIFMVTVIITLAEDLLLGIAAGIFVKFIIELINGVHWKSFLKARYNAKQKGDSFIIQVEDSAVFSNLLGFKKVINKNIEKSKIILDFSKANFVDHSFMSYVKYLEQESEPDRFKIIGLEKLRPLSKHYLAARKMIM